MDSYLASNGSCFMVTWIILNNHFLEVGLTQNRETMAPRMLTTVDLFYFIMCEDPCEHKFVEIIWLRAWSHMTSHYTWRSVTALHDFGGVLGRPWDTFLLGSHNFMVTALGLCVKWPKARHFPYFSPHYPIPPPWKEEEKYLIWIETITWRTVFGPKI